MSGAFGDRYLAGAGFWKLFVFLADAVFLRGAWIPGRRPGTSVAVITKNGQAVGFYQLDLEVKVPGRRILTIVLFAVDAQYRNQGLAREVLLGVVKSQPRGTEIVAYCSKYARAMQHVLHRLRFSRSKTPLGQLTQFGLVLPGLASLPGRHMANEPAGSDCGTMAGWQVRSN